MLLTTRARWAVYFPLSILAILAVTLPRCSPAAQSGETTGPELQVPSSSSAPVIDGKLDEPCWQDAAIVGPFFHGCAAEEPIRCDEGARECRAPIGRPGVHGHARINKQTPGKPRNSTTTAFVLRDADRLYVGVRCGPSGLTPDAGDAADLPDISKQEHVALLIDSNQDQSSYYLIVLTRQGTVQASYNEHFPPWHDPTWNRRRPQFQCVAAASDHGWCAEFSLPFEIFDKNKTLTSEIGFNIRRHDARQGQTYCWCGEFSNPAQAGRLAGIPPRSHFPEPSAPAYAGCYQLDGGYRQGFNLPPDAPAAGAEQGPMPLGPGSTHPGTTGEVRIELEEFLLGGNVHARALIWDLAVDEKKGELYVLSAARRKSAIELRVFDRRGHYLRTIMPFDPTLSRHSVSDLCRKTVSEGAVELVVPKLFETCGTEPSLYGEYWHLPQSMTIAPNGDLILSNLFKRTLWRLKPDGSLPAEGWTSIYNPQRNEPFENAGWLIGPWHANGLRPYLSYGKFCLPDMCFDGDGYLYVSGGVWSPLSQFYSTNWEVPGRGQGEAVWKYRLLEGTRLEGVRDFRVNGTMEIDDSGRDHLGFAGQPGSDDAHFNQPCGLAIDDHLVVADSGNNRLQVFEKDGRLVASVGSFTRDGQDVPLQHPTALAIDREQQLYVLALVDSTRRLIKLKGWREPRLLAISDPLEADTVRIALDHGVDPPLVWIANGAGRGTLLQLAGDDLSATGKWADDGERLSSPIQYGYLPALNIDPRTGHLYVEDDSYYHRGVYGEVFKLDQSGNVLKKWPPLPFNEVQDWNGEPLYDQAHATPVYRYPEEPLFLDSLFGKDGNIYRWKRDAKTVKILRLDRAGRPLAFESTKSHALVVDRLPHPSVQPRNHFVYRGMDVDGAGNLYYVNSRNSIDVYDSDGNPRRQDLLQLIDARGLLVDEQGDLYVLSCPRGPARSAEGDWTSRHLYLSKYRVSGGEPIWSRRWEGILGCGAGRVAWMQTTCVCLTSRLHQALDGKGYLYVANKFSVQVIDCRTGRCVGEFGSYGNLDCLGAGSAHPHPQLPFGTISCLAVWKDRLFVLDGLNARIAKCRLIYDSAKAAR